MSSETKNRDEELVQTTIRIHKWQKERVEEMAINLSKWVRKKLEQEFDDE